MIRLPTRDNGTHFFTIGLILGILACLLWLFSPFFGALVGAVTLGISFFPLHLRIKKMSPRLSPSVHALISDFLVALFIVAPIFFMTWATVEYSDTWSPLLKNWQNNIAQWRDGKILESSGMRDIFGWMSQTFALRPSQFRQQLMKSADYLLSALGSLGTRVAAELISSLTNVGLMLFALFFVFRDGPAIYSEFQSYLPLREEQKLACRLRGAHMITGVIRGWLLGSVIQGVVAAIGYLVAGVEGWIFFGFLTILTGLLPVIGTALVWVPLAVHAFFRGSVAQGIFLTAWGILVISLIDNVLRPLLAGKNSDVPFVYLFFSLLGGIELWGIKGIIIGPVLVAIAPVIFDIYKMRYVNSESTAPTKSLGRTSHRVL